MADSVIAFYKSLIDHQPGDALLHCHLAQSYLDEADASGAVEAASEAIGLDSSCAEAWLVRARANKLTGQWYAASVDFDKAAQLAPGRTGVLVEFATCLIELDRLIEAEAALRSAVHLFPQDKAAHANLGSVLVKLGRLHEAEAPCQAALLLDPDLVGAHQNLSGILASTNPDAARWHRDAAYKRQQVFSEPACDGARRILVLAAADVGNVPLRHLMDRSRFALTSWYVEYANPKQIPELPGHDVVFNAIGDFDLMPPLHHDVSLFLDGLGSRLLNSPQHVEQTSRSRLPSLLADIPDILVPSIVRYDESIQPSLADPALCGLECPLLVRPIGSHGGQGLAKVDTLAAFHELALDKAYVTQFVDFRSPDGWYRKYRAIFVSGEPLPYHLAISNTWLVHYWTAGMERDEHRRAEEQQFLADPPAMVGVKAWNAIAHIGKALRLDYAGIDFGVLADGRVIVFEANATMLVHPETDPMFAYREPAVRAIQAAFTAMIDSRIGAAE